MGQSESPGVQVPVHDFRLVARFTDQDPHGGCQGRGRQSSELQCDSERSGLLMKRVL